MRIFPDTNIFLHFHSIDQINFENIIPGYSKETTLKVVLAPIVIQELDNHKWNHPNAKIRERASAITKKLLGWVDSSNGTIREKLEIAVGNQPKKETITLLGLDPNSGDDLLIASVIEDIKNGNEGVYVLSNDTGVNLKCISLKLKRAQLPDSCLLPATSDSSHKEIEKLRKEIEKIKNATQRPNLKITFKNGKSLFEPNIKSARLIDEHWIQSELLKEKMNFPHLNPYGIRLNLNPRFGGPLVEPDPEATKKYNSEVDEYLLSYETYLRRNIEVENATNLIIKVGFKLDNSGTGFAEDIRAYLILPSQLSWLESEKEFPKAHKPKRPERPKTAIEKLAAFGSERFGGLPLSMLGPVSSPSEKNVTSWVDGNDFCFSIKKCLHHHTTALDNGYIYLKSESEVKPFQISYKIIDKGSPEPHCGEILVKPTFNNESDSKDNEEEEEEEEEILE